MEALNVANIDLHSLCRDDHKMLRRRLASILKEPGDIDDVIQDAYLRLMEVNTRDEKILNPRLHASRVRQSRSGSRPLSSASRSPVHER